MEDFNGINEALSKVLNDIETMMEEQHNRARFQENYAALRQKYEETEMELNMRKPTKKVEALLQAKEAFELERHTGRVLTRPPE